jgi:hypothetical protein
MTKSSASTLFALVADEAMPTVVPRCATMACMLPSEGVGAARRKLGAPLTAAAPLPSTANAVEAGIALAKQLAGDGLWRPRRQAFLAGPVDEAAKDVAPMVLGEGVRFFGSHTGTVLLDDPDQAVQGDRMLHLHYTVKR